MHKKLTWEKKTFNKIGNYPQLTPVESTFVTIPVVAEFGVPAPPLFSPSMLLGVMTHF